MTETGRGLQIVDVTKNHAYLLDEHELEKLLLNEEVKDLPVVVVSVAGAYRGGKSFLLNFFLRYLSAPPSARKDGSWLGEDSEPLAGFQWRSGIKATTLGILMWSEPFITTLPSGDKVAVILIDTQGNFDRRSTVRDNSTIFALSTLLSSIQIYNLSQNIKEDDLQHLELFTEYGKLVNSGGSNKKAFQVLEFLVRDWQFPDENYPYGAVGGERLLQENLEITEDLAKEMKDLRQHIRASFEKVSCFLMPHPGFKVLSPSFHGEINDIDPNFRKHLVDLVNSIFGPEKLLPKKINGEQVKSRDLFNYFKTYMELFNSDKIPNPTNIMAATVKAGLLSAVSESHDIYEKGMESEVGPTQPNVPAIDLEFLHKKYLKEATEAFTNKKKMGTKEEADKYLDDLTKDLNHRLPQYLQSNLSKIQTAINKAKETYDEKIQEISKDQPLCVHPSDLEQVHKEAEDAAIKTYDAAQKRVTKKYDDDRTKFIQGFQKQKELLRRTNEQSNNLAVSLLRMEYFQRMQLKASQDPPLTDVEFKEEHAAALRQALKDFDSRRSMPNQRNYIEDVYKTNLTEACQDSFTQLKALNKSKNKEAMQAGIDAYDKYMKTFANNATQCLHPDDLEEAHRMALCRALTTFHPKKECSDGIDYNDEDEATLNQILRQRHEDFVKNNESSNETAVLLAYNTYVSSIDDACRFSLWWLLIVPYIVHLQNRNAYHEEAKKKALEVFYGQRRDGGYHSTDPYRDNLDRLIQEYYDNNYKK